MNPELIKASLRIKFKTLSKFADALGVHPNTVYSVIDGGIKSKRVAQAIAKAIGEEPNKLWPGKYPELDNDFRKQQAIATRNTLRDLAPYRKAA
jgi:lambda repressor-like predicted transcriptional regulator